MHFNYLAWILLTAIQLAIAAILELLKRRGLFQNKRAIPTALIGLELLVMVPLLPSIDKICAKPLDTFLAAWFVISLACAIAGSLVLIGALSLKSK